MIIDHKWQIHQDTVIDLELLIGMNDRRVVVELRRMIFVQLAWFQRNDPKHWTNLDDYL